DLAARPQVGTAWRAAKLCYPEAAKLWSHPQARQQRLEAGVVAPVAAADHAWQPPAVLVVAEPSGFGGERAREAERGPAPRQPLAPQVVAGLAERVGEPAWPAAAAGGDDVAGAGDLGLDLGGGLDPGEAAAAV